MTRRAGFGLLNNAVRCPCPNCTRCAITFRVIRAPDRRSSLMAAKGTVASALAEYFQAEGLPENGGLDSRWVHLRIGPIPLAFPNIRARREAVRYHDAHHVLTGYRTDWRGEAEIGAFEIGSGCGRYWVGWWLDSGAMGIGAVLWPRRTWRAFVRGRRSGNLFGEPFERLLPTRVADLQRRLGLDREPQKGTELDGMIYAFWVIIGLGWMVILPLWLAVFGLMWLL